MSLLFKSTYMFEKLNFYKYDTSFLAYVSFWFMIYGEAINDFIFFAFRELMRIKNINHSSIKSFIKFISFIAPLYEHNL